jgi:hypothetical protein
MATQLVMPKVNRMNLQASIAMRFGGPGSGCNPAVAEPRCGRPSGGQQESTGTRSFTLPNGTSFSVSNVPALQDAQLATFRAQELAKLPPNVQEAFKQGVDTQGIFSENGVYTPERQALHDQIISTYLEGHQVQANPKVIIVGGGTASGKSGASKDAKNELHDFVYINTDDVRAMLPEIGAFVGNDNQHLLHEEAGYIRDRILGAATEAHLNIILDAPGSQGIVDYASRAEKKGYGVAYYFVHRDVESAMPAAMGRKYHATTLSDLRDVPKPRTFESHGKARGAVDKLQRGNREFRVYDNELGFNTRQNLVFHRTADGKVLVYNKERVGAISHAKDELPQIPESIFRR